VLFEIEVILLTEYASNKNVFARFVQLLFLIPQQEEFQRRKRTIHTLRAFR